jgi:hypothetical protein
MKRLIQIRTIFVLLGLLTGSAQATVFGATSHLTLIDRLHLAT